MTFRSVPAIVLAAVLLAFAPSVAAQSGDAPPRAKQKARAAAESWLALVDADEFGESWDEAAAPFRERVERADWVQQAERLRDSVASLSTRTLTQTQYRTALSRTSVEGPFVLIKYRTNRNASRFDELLLMVQEDTTWKVTGYQVTPLRPSTP